MIEKPKIECMDNINQLKNKEDRLNRIINHYTLLKEDTDNLGIKKTYEFFVNHLIKKKLNIQEIIDNIYSSIIKMPSKE